MPDSKAKKAWIAAHTFQITAKINRNTDKDIVEYYGDKIPATTMKMVLRDYMARHPKGEIEK